MQSPEKITTPFTEEEEGEWMTDGDSEESGMSQQSWQEEEEQIAPPQIAQKRRGETAKQKKGSQSSSVTAVNSTGKKTRPRWDFPPAQNKLANQTHCRPAKRQRPASPAQPDPLQPVRDEIFVTIYATFQRARALDLDTYSLKIRNRTLRSLTRSCLYHQQESQLQRTKRDAEALLAKHCRSLETEK
ncbi:33k [Murine adenovirus 3]|uniref:33k n=1 Tax=Murine adenovirus 3 TaxID=573199 RepID=C3SAV2_9ADEN|nr:33k [Murine adenovirus 3]ACJ14521.1 33k [Murine adenovirus 3]